MRATARTTQGGIRRIRESGCAATGPLARNRPSDPNAPTSPKFTKPVTEGEAIRLAQAGDAAAFEFLYQLDGRRVFDLVAPNDGQCGFDAPAQEVTPFGLPRRNDGAG